jgi:exopolyphosphatase/guanosine-5'-triphosphate,3'-diphosphate pyrophosphatase
MSIIVPRWEWRTFGERLGAAGDRLDALPPEHSEESDEVYLLAGTDGDTVKIRAGLMDIKHLAHTNEDGLEQWTPTMKAAFPLAADDVAAALQALGATVPQLARASYTMDELIDDVVRPSDDIEAVRVHKLRRHFTLGGCMAELTDVRTDGASTRTIAIESPDPARVIAAVRDAGLGGRQNVSFPSGLRALVASGARRYAVIDVGTNSVKFHIGERDAAGVWRRVVDRSEVTRLGEGLDASGRLGEDPMQRTIAAIAGMAAEATRSDVLAIAAVGTAGLRAAQNSAEFVGSVQARCGIPIEVISGDEEARLAYRAATSGLGRSGGAVVVFDSGGGSSQFTFGQDDHIDERFSVEVGAVRFTERHGLDGAVSEQELGAAKDAIAAALVRLDGRPAPDAVVAMGGTVTNLAAVKHNLARYDPDVVQGSVLDCAEIDRQIELYRTRTADERRQIVGLQPKRAEVILAGACIVRTVLAKLGREALQVSDRGLRHGLLAERFGS